MGNLFLAVWTVVAAASGNNDSFYRRLARKAGLSFASVNPVLELEKTLFPVCSDVV